MVWFSSLVPINFFSYLSSARSLHLKIAIVNITSPHQIFINEDHTRPPSTVNQPIILCMNRIISGLLSYLICWRYIASKSWKTGKWNVLVKYPIKKKHRQINTAHILNIKLIYFVWQAHKYNSTSKTAVVNEWKVIIENMRPWEQNRSKFIFLREKEIIFFFEWF